MELNFELLTAPARSAASVILLRDGAPGLEVFLIERSGLSDVLGGAYVFPGGKVDAQDADAVMGRLLDREAAQLHALLGEADIAATDAAALFVAAAREVFEESGILLAQAHMHVGSAGAAVDAARAGSLRREGRHFEEVLSMLGLQLHTRALQPWTRWITPMLASVSRKRFDTRFFIARAPSGQTASHDNHEATNSVWLTPREALVQYQRAHIELAPPQIMTLAHLSRFDTVQAAWDYAASRPPPVILPEPFDEDGSRVLTYPGDARHSVRVRAMPGPTRLRYHNQRFEPFDGFEALFA